MMNREQVKALFDQEAVSFGNCDGVPIRRVAELFGEDAARYGDNQGEDGSRNMTVFYAGPYQVHYMTAAGFHRAAAYRNAVEIGQREEQEDAANGRHAGASAGVYQQDAARYPLPPHYAAL